VWASSSFRYIKGGQEGWSQSNLGQLTGATTEKISQTGTQSINWQFDPIKAEISLKTVGGDFRYTNPPYGIFYNDKMLFEAVCSDPGGSATPRIFMIILDDKTLAMVEKLGSGVACSSFPYLYEFGDLNNAANRLKMENFLKAIPANKHVVAMSVNRVPFELFSTSLKDAFKSVGAAKIDNLKNGYPYGLVGQKGAAPGTAQEETASTDDLTKPTSQVINFKTTIRSRQQAGSITSTVIGPALSWNALYHNIERYKDGNDAYKLSIFGIDATGHQQVLAEDVTSKAYDLSDIDAK
jgi:hypothetical protein